MRFECTIASERNGATMLLEQKSTIPPEGICKHALCMHYRSDFSGVRVGIVLCSKIVAPGISWRIGNEVSILWNALHVLSRPSCICTYYIFILFMYIMFSVEPVFAMLCTHFSLGHWESGTRRKSRLLTPPFVTHFAWHQAHVRMQLMAGQLILPFQHKRFRYTNGCIDSRMHVWTELRYMHYFPALVERILHKLCTMSTDASEHTGRNTHIAANTNTNIHTHTLSQHTYFQCNFRCRRRRRRRFALPSSMKVARWM